MLKSSKRRSVLFALAAVLVLSAGATAYWTAGGAGTGTATTEDTAQSALIVVQGTTLADMYPGDSAQTISGTFTNPNPGPIFIGTVTASIASVHKPAGTVAVGCSAADFTLGGTITSSATEAAVADNTTWTGATIRFNNTAANQDACKGATVNLAYTIS